MRASTAAFAKDLDKASQLAFGTAREIERSFKVLGGIAAGALTAAATAVTALTVHAIENAAEMGRLAESTGLTVQQFSGLAYAAKLADVGAGELSKALVILSKNLEKSNEQTQEGAAAHSALSTLFRGSIPVFKSTDEAFSAIAERLSKLPDGFQKTALTVQILGRNGAALLPVINQGAKGLAELRKEAADLGVEIDSNTSKAAQKLEDDIKRLKAASEGLGNEILKRTVPALIALTEAAVGFAKSDLKTKVKEAAEFIGHRADGAAGAGAAAGQIAKLGVAAGTAGEKLDEHKGKIAGLIPFNQKLADTYKSTVTQLGQEITELTLGSAAAESYKLKTLGASDAQIKFVQTLREMVNNLKAGKDALTGTFSNQQFIAGLKTSVDSVNELTDSTEKGFAVLRELTEGPFKDYIEKTQALKPLVDQNIISQEQYNEAIDKLKDKLGFVAVKLDPLAKLSKDFQKSIGEAFESAIIGARSFGDVLKGLLTAIEEAILRTLVFKSIADSLSGVGGIGGFIGGIFGAIAGGKAGGGSVSGGSAYLVGEKGPELFVPAMSGTIVPNGGAGQQVIYNIDARGADATVIEMRVRRAIAKSQKESVAMSVASVREMSLRTT